MCVEPFQLGPAWLVAAKWLRRHIGKGFHECDKQLPIPVTAILLELHDEPAVLQPIEGLTDDKQSEIARFLLRAGI